MSEEGYEDEDCYDGNHLQIEESCYMCCAEQVSESDRWNFELVDEEVEESHWLCRQCHGRFSSLVEFDRFRSDIPRIAMYRAAARLQRLLILDAPKSILASEVLGSLFSSMMIPDEMGGKGPSSIFLTGSAELVLV